MNNKKKILISSDSFKSTLSSVQISHIVDNVIKEYFKDTYELISIPIADGGEGSLEAISQLQISKKINVKTKDCDLNDIDSYYYIIDDFAFIELANTAGFSISKLKDPKITKTYGVGAQIKDAINKGIKKIYIALGGSATNDVGVGMLEALGYKFYDKNNNQIIPFASNLKMIYKIEKPNIDFNEIKVTCLCDVKNIATGKDGATYVYGKQKGLKDDELEDLDQNVKHFCNLIKTHTNKDVEYIEGSGAAGAIAASCIGFLNANVKSGFDVISEILKLEDAIKKADLVISGEGSLDIQSFNGKVLSKMANLCTKYNKKLIVIVGQVDDVYAKKYDECGITAIFSINRKAQDFSISKSNSESNYKNTILNILRVYDL